MIGKIKFKLQEGIKIRDLKPSNIMFYCECKALLVDEESANADVTIDLCPIHEEMQRKLEAGQIAPEQAILPKVRIEF